MKILFWIGAVSLVIGMVILLLSMYLDAQKPSLKFLAGVLLGEVLMFLGAGLMFYFVKTERIKLTQELEDDLRNLINERK